MSGGKELQLEIIRDTEGSGLNRFCQEIKTKVLIPQGFYLTIQDTLYYIEMGTGSTIAFHRGGKTGHVIATAECCEEKKGTSKIQMVEVSKTVDLEHSPRRLVVIPPKTTFSFDGNEYSWKGYTDLFDENKVRLIAQYNPTLIENADNKIGQFLIREGDTKKLTDLIVFSAFVVQHRSDARKRAVSQLNFNSNILRALLARVGHDRESSDRVINRHKTYCSFYDNLMII